MLDIGGNVGWYPSLLGRYGYSILSFEAFERNYYVEKKNVCHLYNNSNIIIITKGLGEKEKICHYFSHKNNEGNGMVIFDDKDFLNNSMLKKIFIKESEVEITTLNSFIPYLSNKNIALMKLDVEGQELKILEGGAKLITQYHVPFIVLEFSPSYLKEVGSEPKKLIQFFIENGYKISIEGFLNNKYLTYDELLAKTGFQINNTQYKKLKKYEILNIPNEIIIKDHHYDIKKELPGNNFSYRCINRSQCQSLLKISRQDIEKIKNKSEEDIITKINKPHTYSGSIIEVAKGKDVLAKGDYIKLATDLINLNPEKSLGWHIHKFEEQNISIKF